MRGACLVHFTLEKPERDFVAAALPHLSVHAGLYKDQPPANCMTEGEITQMRNDLTKKVTHFPDCVKRHLRNACFECGDPGHYSRFCPVIYGATKPMTCVDMQYGMPDMLPGQRAREKSAHEELAQKREEEEAAKKKKAEQKKKKTAKKVTEEPGAQQRVLALLPFVAGIYFCCELLCSERPRHP